MDTLMSMGYTSNQVKVALQRCSSIEAAIEYLMLLENPDLDDQARAGSEGIAEQIDLYGQLALGQLARAFLPESPTKAAEMGEGNGSTPARNPSEKVIELATTLKSLG